MIGHSVSADRWSEVMAEELASRDFTGELMDGMERETDVVNRAISDGVLSQQTWTMNLSVGCCCPHSQSPFIIITQS